MAPISGLAAGGQAAPSSLLHLLLQWSGSSDLNRCKRVADLTCAVASGPRRGRPSRCQVEGRGVRVPSSAPQASNEEARGTGFLDVSMTLLLLTVGDRAELIATHVTPVLGLGSTGPSAPP